MTTGLRNTLLALVGAIGILMIVAVSHVYLFTQSDTSYERIVRSKIANGLDTMARRFRTLSSYGRLNTASAVQQAILVEDDFIAMTDRLVYQGGQPIKLSIRSPEPVQVDLVRVEQERTVVVSSRSLAPAHRAPSLMLNTFDGFAATEFDVLTFTLDDAASGWFQFEVKGAGASRHVPFFVEGPKTSNILFVESTDTMKAYLAANGLRTFYKSGQTPLLGNFTRPVSYPMDYPLTHFAAQPIDSAMNCSDHLANADLVLKSHLAGMGMKFDVASDDFLHNSGNLERYRLIIFGTHNEYWSETKLQNISRYTDAGGDLLFLGGNTAYRFIQRSPNFDLIWGDSLLTTRHEVVLLNVIGAYYDEKGYNTFAPFTASQAAEKSPLMSGIAPGTTFGSGTDFPPCQSTVTGASGHETDKLQTGASDFVVLASGQNPDGGGADVVYRSSPAGAHILNFGSLALWHRIGDPVITGIIERFDALSAASAASGKPN